MVVLYPLVLSSDPYTYTVTITLHRTCEFFVVYSLLRMVDGNGDGCVCVCVCVCVCGCGCVCVCARSVACRHHRRVVVVLLRILRLLRLPVLLVVLLLVVLLLLVIIIIVIGLTLVAMRTRLCGMASPEGTARRCAVRRASAATQRKKERARRLGVRRVAPNVRGLETQYHHRQATKVSSACVRVCM